MIQDLPCIWGSISSVNLRKRGLKVINTDMDITLYKVLSEFLFYIATITGSHSLTLWYVIQSSFPHSCTSRSHDIKDLPIYHIFFNPVAEGDCETGWIEAQAVDGWVVYKMQGFTPVISIKICNQLVVLTLVCLLVIATCSTIVVLLCSPIV